MAEETKQVRPNRREAYGIEPLNYFKQPTPVRPTPKATKKRRIR